MSPGFDDEILKISSRPLAPAGDKSNSDFFEQKFPLNKKDLSPRKGIYSVEQKLSWETAAVKRIDRISIGNTFGDDISHSHRTFPYPLRPLNLPPGITGTPFAAAAAPAPALAAAAPATGAAGAPGSLRSAAT